MLQVRAPGFRKGACEGPDGSEVERPGAVSFVAVYFFPRSGLSAAREEALDRTRLGGPNATWARSLRASHP